MILLLLLCYVSSGARLLLFRCRLRSVPSTFVAGLVVIAIVVVVAFVIFMRKTMFIVIQKSACCEMF